MTNSQALWRILGQAYQASVLHRGSSAKVHEAFRQQVAADPLFLTYAKAELGRMDSLEDDRCFVSKVSKQFLNDALQRLKSEPIQNAVDAKPVA